MTWPARVRSLLGRPSKPTPAASAPGMVRFYDVACQRVVQIPPAELRPGCVQARIQGIEGVVWIAADDVKEGPVRHPPFGEDLMSYIRDIQAAFAEHRPLTVEQWEEGFRRDVHAEREIAGFSYAADVYRRFTASEPSAEKRRDVYRLLITCMTTSPDAVWHVAKLDALSRPEAERIVRRFYGGEKADKPPAG